MIHNTTLLRVNDSFHHCASIASDGESLLLTAYYGPECTDTQRVFLKFKDFHLDLPFKTGNPVIWFENGKFLLMYSVFEDVDKDGNEPSRPVERWKFCSNRLAEVSIEDTKITLKNDHEIDGAFGLLARCSPIMFNGKSLWPLYREKDPRCEIWTYDGTTLKHLSNFGDYLTSYKANFGNLGTGVAIQPTLVVINGELRAYCRNVTRNYKFAWLATSKDGIKWSDLTQTNIPNGNSSLVHVVDTNLFVFNHTPTRERMILASMSQTRGIPIDIPIMSNRDSTGYPNYCWHKGDLIIVHSNRNVIAQHQFSKDYLKMVFGNEL